MAQKANAPEDDTGLAAPRRSRARGKAKVPLLLKIFLLTALLIIIVVGIAVGVTIQRANSIATQTVNSAIQNAANLFREFEERRLKELTLGALTVARDVNFNAYVQDALQGAPVEEALPPADVPAGSTAAEAAAQGTQAPLGEATVPTEPAATPPVEAAIQPAAAIDVASILDLLQEKQSVLKTDLLILTDDQGVLVARTDMVDITGMKREDLYNSQPLVKQLVDNLEIDSVSGVLAVGGELYHAAVVPLDVGANRVRIAFLVNAYAIDEKFANQIANSTQAGVLFLVAPDVASDKESSPRSANAPSVASLQAMDEVRDVFTKSRSIPAHTVVIDRSEYVITGQPLGTPPRGAAVFVRSLDTELAPFREIERTLLMAGGAALILAFLLSWLIAKRLTKPITQLADMAQSVTEGDYSAQPNIDGTDEVGILARAFGQMIVSLRDKAELEELYAQMSSRFEEKAAAAPVLHPPRKEEGTILVTDLRGLSVTAGAGKPEDVIASITRAMRIQEAEVRRQDGSVREIVGHRLVSVFPGERGVIHAIRAARAISEELALQTDAKNPLTVGVGMATGEFVTGTVELSGETGTALVGNAPLLALLFAWEAPTGYAYISLESAQAAGNEIMSNSGREEVRLKWLPAPMPVASLPLQSLTTGMMAAVGGASPTVRLNATTVPGATAPGSAPAELKPGSIFANRYLVDQMIGRGGMGIVYKATDQQLDETVAIKTLPGEVMSRAPEELERFKREIRLARKITHRNVLRTYDYGEAEGVYFISMEFVRGYTLADLLEETPKLSMRVGLGVTRQICRGLDAAHEQGVIHRDIKPQNVLIDHRGEVKLMDFGIARMAEAKDAMTQAGLIVGTPHYMSPEQVQGKQLDSRSDVYSMGVMMYEMLAGERPFDADSLTGILAAHITQTPKPLGEKRPDLDRQLIAIVMRCLAKDLKDRYANAGALLADLDRVQTTAAAA